MGAVYWLIDTVLALLTFAVVVSAIASWLVAFNVINPYNAFVRTILDTLNRIVEPMCRPIRKLLPDLGGVDFSPLIVILLLMFARKLLVDLFFGLM